MQAPSLPDNPTHTQDKADGPAEAVVARTGHQPAGEDRSRLVSAYTQGPRVQMLLAHLRRLMQTVAGKQTRMEVDSSALRAVAYDRKHRLLTVWFCHGGVYEYGGVTPKTYRELLQADSIGRFFVRRIRDRYPYRRLEAPEAA